MVRGRTARGEASRGSRNWLGPAPTPVPCRAPSTDLPVPGAGSSADCWQARPERFRVGGLSRQPLPPPPPKPSAQRRLTPGLAPWRGASPRQRARRIVRQKPAGATAPWVHWPATFAPATLATPAVARHRYRPGPTCVPAPRCRPGSPPGFRHSAPRAPPARSAHSSIPPAGGEPPPGVGKCSNSHFDLRPRQPGGHSALLSFR